MKVRYDTEAIEDLNGIADYLSIHSPKGAVSVKAAIDRTLAVLRNNPFAGHRQDVPGVRKILVRRYGYAVYYSVDVTEDAISILRIFHPAQNRPFVDQ